MSASTYERVLIAIAVAFTLFFAFYVFPPVLETGDLVGAFAAGFVNPLAAGFSTDTILCWVVLAVWIVHEGKTRTVPGRWLCLALGLFPGVVVGFAAYLILRERHAA